MNEDTFILPKGSEVSVIDDTSYVTGVIPIGTYKISEGILDNRRFSQKKKRQISFIRQLKLARKNAQREIDQSHRAGMEGRILDVRSEFEICFRHSYPLGLVCEHLCQFDEVIKFAPRTRGLWRVLRAIRRKGKVVYSWQIRYFVKAGKTDLRELEGKTYSITHILNDYKKYRIMSQKHYSERIERMNLGISHKVIGCCYK